MNIFQDIFFYIRGYFEISGFEIKRVSFIWLYYRYMLQAVPRLQQYLYTTGSSDKTGKTTDQTKTAQISKTSELYIKRGYYILYFFLLKTHFSFKKKTKKKQQEIRSVL